PSRLKSILRILKLSITQMIFVFNVYQSLFSGLITAHFELNIKVHVAKYDVFYVQYK
ncbi:unnamed protein product, partial [Tenebrio molitor]